MSRVSCNNIATDRHDARIHLAPRGKFDIVRAVRIDELELYIERRARRAVPAAAARPLAGSVPRPHAAMWHAGKARGIAPTCHTTRAAALLASSLICARLHVYGADACAERGVRVVSAEAEAECELLRVLGEGSIACDGVV